MKEIETEVHYSKSEILDSVESINLLLVTKEPFFGHLFSGLNREIRNDIPTACIAFHPESNFLGLWVNPKFWMETLKGVNKLETEGYRFGVIKHEILHIVFKHIFRAKDFSNKKLFNIAADLVINQNILPNQLIDGACILNMFPDFKLKPNETVEYYYMTLLKEKEKSDRTKEEDKNESQKNLDKMMNNIDNHDTWKEIIETKEGLNDLMASKIDAQIMEISKKMRNTSQWGSVPGFIKEYVMSLEDKQKPSINWKHALRRFSASSFKTSVKSTLRRPSKRYGTTPGTKIKKKKKLLVAIDTSGSVDDESLTLFFNEIKHMLDSDTIIRIIECDTQIHAEYDFKGVVPSNITGRGGTDFNAPFQYAITFNPDAIIYFTDGYCSPPTVKVRTNKVMWIICKNGGDTVENMRAMNFEGTIIKMNY